MKTISFNKNPNLTHKNQTENPDNKPINQIKNHKKAKQKNSTTFSNEINCRILWAVFA